MMMIHREVLGLSWLQPTGYQAPTILTKMAVEVSNLNLDVRCLGMKSLEKLPTISVSCTKFVPACHIVAHHIVQIVEIADDW